nr:ComEC/Rec2 family competence protein [Sphaerochaetaceae bacterium]
GFNAKRVRVKRRGSVNIFRNKVDNFITSHLSSSKEVFSLQCLLLLGRKTEAKSSLSEMARESGTSYLLALSGMHISLFSFLLGFVLAPCLGKKRGRVVSLSLLLVYVIVVGPKPSLVRALLFSTVLFVFPQISAIEALFISLFLQLLFLPESLLELSSVYSYLSLSGILAFGEVLKKNIDRLIYLPLFILNSLAASVSAIVYTVPFSYAVFKSYTFSSIFTGPLAIVVVYLFMVISIISLFVSPLDKVLVKIYDILSLILEKGGTLAPFETLKPYFLLLFCILCLVLLSTILSFIRERKRCGISTIQV